MLPWALAPTASGMLPWALARIASGQHIHKSYIYLSVCVCVCVCVTRAMLPSAPPAAPALISSRRRLP